MRNRNCVVRERMHYQAWCREYERIILTEQPGISGRLDWPTAAYCYSVGQEARDAAAHYLERLGKLA